MRLLFASLLLAQALDLHSTLTAPAQRREVNPAIVWLAGHIGLRNALLCVKCMAVLVIALLYRSWKRNGASAPRRYVLLLLALNGEYAWVLLNNYA